MDLPGTFLLSVLLSPMRKTLKTDRSNCNNGHQGPYRAARVTVAFLACPEVSPD
jgi:hypothetical protein